jgi:hypothetical protein
MKNHMWVKEVSLLQHGPSYFYKDNQCEWLSRWSDQGNQSKYFSSTSTTCFLLRTSFIPIT